MLAVLQYWISVGGNVCRGFSVSEYSVACKCALLNCPVIFLQHDEFADLMLVAKICCLQKPPLTNGRKVT